MAWKSRERSGHPGGWVRSGWWTAAGDSSVHNCTQWRHGVSMRGQSQNRGDGFQTFMRSGRVSAHFYWGYMVAVSYEKKEMHQNFSLS